MVVLAKATRMADGYTLLRVGAGEAMPSPRSGTDRVEVTDGANCEKTRARVWYLDPGDALTYHRQGEQEELYFQFQGPGQMRVGGDDLTVPERAVVRVAPDTPRQVYNDGEETHGWFVVGAPPVDSDGVPIEE